MTTHQNQGRVIAALGLIALGILFWMDLNLLWPMYVLVPGIAFLAVAFLGGRITAALAIPGMLIAGTGTILFIQNLTDYWESWSYAWALYGVFLGMGFVIMGELMETESLQALGRGFTRVSLIVFAVAAFFMELVFGVGGYGLGGALLPLLLVGAGTYLLLESGVLPPNRTRPSKHQKNTKRKNDKVFTGPIVYGSRMPEPSRLSLSDVEDDPVRSPVNES
ncbi:MAG: hypothetical protein JW966_16275 [Anaerolineae bacterium]|nr:hypothetical protein [Anaerolineae bacterium]